MSTASKGKKYEREVCNLLRDKGYVAERIRGSGGGSGTKSGDIIFCSEAHWPDDVQHAHDTRGTDKQGLTIARAIENNVVDRVDVYDCEVKYKSDGFARLYGEMYRVGVEDADTIKWDTDIGHVYTVTAREFLRSDIVSNSIRQCKSCLYVNDAVNHLTKNCLNALQGEGTAKPPDFVFFKRSGRGANPSPWILAFTEKLQ